MISILVSALNGDGLAGQALADLAGEAGLPQGVQDKLRLLFGGKTKAKSDLAEGSNTDPVFACDLLRALWKCNLSQEVVLAKRPLSPAFANWENAVTPRFLCPDLIDAEEDYTDHQFVDDHADCPMRTVITIR